jgi:hypothetical protein
MKKTTKNQQQQEQERPPMREMPGYDDVLYFALPGLLPASYRFAFHERLHILNLLCASEDGPKLLLDQQFTVQEATVLLPLLRAYPTYCPFDVLHAHFSHVAVTEKESAQSQRRIAAALQMGTGETEMRPLRNVISRTRLKLLAFNIDIVSILEVGYLLLYASRRKGGT